MCGEREQSGTLFSRPFGSSPRVRGTPRWADQLPEAQRFIPACAGNAHSGIGTGARIAVHPRVCGERARTPPPSWRVAGSSPRVRGTRSWNRRWLSRVRFIPACAGNALRFHDAAVHVAVHPRVCGERRIGAWFAYQPRGSSPRVRGTPVTAGQAHHAFRFIPACAGNATGHHPRVGVLPVHPRVCGERPSAKPTSNSGFGSSPRVRGTPCHPDGEQATTRFIPACAGNALSRNIARLSLYGSSPRVRGTHRQGMLTAG